MRRWYFGFVMVLFLFLCVVRISYAVERITTFTDEINILRDGTMRVSEIIKYDFDDTNRHGIYRFIPYTKTNADGKKFRIEISDIDVRIDGEMKVPFTHEYSGDSLKLRIGDAQRTLTGEHYYILSYVVSGALTYFSDHEELYWNVTGNGWSVPIEYVGASVRPPVQLRADQIKEVCFIGVKGSTEECESKYIAGTAQFTSTRQLGTNEGMTIVYSFPKGIVAVREPSPVISFFDSIIGKFVLFGIVLVALYWYFILPVWIPIKWYLFGRDPRIARSNVSAWFEPPKTKSGRPLTAAETGTLIDENAGHEEITGLIIQLAQKGFLTIKETSKDVFSLMQKEGSDPDVLIEYERSFYHRIFTGKKSVKLDSHFFYDVVLKTHKDLYSVLVNEKMFPANPDTIRKRYLILLACAVPTFNFFLMITAGIFGRIMPRKTEYGAQMSDVARGLRSFLSSQERQLNFQAQEQMMFEKLLPYAVAFGVEKKWMQRFEGMKLQQPAWYVGTDSSSFWRFGFAHAVSSSIRSYSSPSQSRSGFSSGFSGGSSGGGGGGGGGGSW